MFKTSKLMFLVLLIAFVMGSFSVQVLAKQTTITFWAGTLPASTAKQVIEEFQAENPDIKVEVSFQPWNGLNEKYIVALQGPNPPDIIYFPSTWTSSYGSMGLLKPLDQFLEQGFKDIFYPASWQIAQLEDITYGIPARIDILALYYNREAFAAAGLPDRAPDTWAEMLEFAKLLTVDLSGDGSIDQYGYGVVGNNFSNVVFRVVPFIWQNQGEVLNPEETKSTLHEPAAVEGVEFYANLYTKEGVAQKSTMSDSAQEVDQLFLNGRVAMTYTGPWLIDIIKEQAPELDYITAPYPRNSAYEERTAVLGGWNFGISSRSKNPEEAFLFLQFLSKPDINALVTTSLPAVEEAFQHERFQDPAYEGFMLQMEYMKMLPNIPESTQIQDIIYEEVQQIMFGRKTAEKAMQDASKRIDSLLQR